MSFTLSSPVTGGAQTGFTSPTYTLATDTAPSNTGKQYAVSAIGGTQAGVDSSSSPSRPFTWTGSRPAVLRQLPAVDPITGVFRSVPRNTYKNITRKGVTPLAAQASQVMVITTTWAFQRAPTLRMLLMYVLVPPCILEFRIRSPLRLATPSLQV